MSNATLGAVKVQATDHSKVKAEVGAGAIANVGIGMAVARNFLGWENGAASWLSDSSTQGTDEIKAWISDSTVSAQKVSLLARESADITAHVGAASGGLAYGDDGFSINGAGVGSVNKISTGVKAFITNTSTTQTQNVDVEAADESTITADATGAAIAASFVRDSTGTLSIGVSIANNEINNNVEAYIDKVTTFNITGNLDITATESATIKSVAVAASLAAGVSKNASSLTLSGGGADATNQIRGKANAYIKDATIGIDGNLSLAAENTSKIDATIVAAVAVSAAVSKKTGLGLAIGAAIAKNLVGWTLLPSSVPVEVKAFIENSSLSIKGSHSQTANSRQEIDAFVGAGGMGVAVAKKWRGHCGSGVGRECRKPYCS